VLETFETHFLQRYHANLQAKLGLRSWTNDDAELADSWWRLLHGHAADFTHSFRSLGEAPDDPEAFLARFEGSSQAREWLDRYLVRLQADGSDEPGRRERMAKVNPVYVLRNYLA